MLLQPLSGARFILHAKIFRPDNPKPPTMPDLPVCPPCIVPTAMQGPEVYMGQRGLL